MVGIGATEATDCFALDDLLTEEERDVRYPVRAFSDREVVPIIDVYREREGFPFELLPKLAAPGGKGPSGFEAHVTSGNTSQRTALNPNVRLRGARAWVENRLARSKGLGDALRVLTPILHNVAWEAVGQTAAYEAALAYARGRAEFGKPIATFRMVQNKFASMLADVTAMQTLCFRLGQFRERVSMTIGVGPLAKMYNAQRAYRVVSKARDALGGDGVLLEHHVAPPRGHGGRLNLRRHRHDPPAHLGTRDHQPPSLFLKVST